MLLLEVLRVAGVEGGEGKAWLAGEEGATGAAEVVGGGGLHSITVAAYEAM